jgi:hypothetical protein
MILGLYYLLVKVLIPKVSNTYKARRSIEGAEIGLESISGEKGGNLSIELTNSKAIKVEDYTTNYKNKIII